MPLKEYQQEVLALFEEWYRSLESKRAEVESISKSLSPEMASTIDYTKMAWSSVSDATYRPRSDGTGRPIPNVCFKVPTGGGKTLLAGHALERMKKRVGLVLWIVPTQAIFEQTQASLSDKSKMLRRCLDRVSGNKVRIIKKDYPLRPDDLNQSLCIMLLMKQGADNGRDDFLKIKRDSATYMPFFPPEDDHKGNSSLVSANPNLDVVPESNQPKHSLLNVFRMIRPTCILDEAHKTRGLEHDKLLSYINDMNPSAVIEFTATPQDGSNILVNVSGGALKREEMIKLPINLTVMSTDTSWKELLDTAHDKFTRLCENASEYSDRYIRPIMLLRTERVSKSQIGAGYIHVQDVQQYLETKDESNSIAIKTSEQDNIRGLDLMSENCPVKYIITKDALKEGWDCPFAYMLVILDKVKSKTSVTQLLGRIMRQPGQTLTGRLPLDQCYVYCRSRDTSNVIKHVKAGLESDGLEGVGNAVVVSGTDESVAEVEMRGRLRPVYLPRVLHRDRTQKWIDLDYDRHILAEIDWNSIHAPDVSGLEPEESFVQTTAVDLGDVQSSTTEDSFVDEALKLSTFVNILSDTVPNKWQAARIVNETIVKLRKAGRQDGEIFRTQRLLLHRIKDHVCGRVVEQAESIFRAKIRKGDIRFDLQVDRMNFKMREKYEVHGSRLTLLKNLRGAAVQRSLFDPVYEEQFDTDPERSFAAHLEATDSITWWHRVAARGQGEYYLRGWQPNKIWPDFVAMFGSTNGTKERELRIYEIKGSQFKNSPDTEYKGKVLEALQGAFNDWGTMKVESGVMKGEFKILFDDQIDEEGARLKHRS